MRKLWLIAALLLVASVGSASAQELPHRDQLSPGQWFQLSPGGETVCGHGAPYSFYYRENPGQDLLIYFQGGGMCWNEQTCSPTGDKTFDEAINPGDPSDNPGLFPVGIFDLGSPENPFINYDMLYVNYCSGDMHTGNNVTGLTYHDVYYEIKNRGAINAAYALNWAYNNIPIPDSVFVAGCSAGAVGAAFWGADIKAHYPNQRVTLLGDSGGGWRGIDGATWNLWGTNYQGATGSSVNNAQFYVGAARQGARIAEYNTASDETQSFFYYVGFSSVQYSEALRANLRDISRGAGNFRSYTMYGDLHCVLPRSEFYTYTMGSDRVRDWVASLAAGEPVNNIS
ncbi:MAG: pectin acetylesterase-family hydrolase [Anaerolineae bacterium]